MPHTYFHGTDLTSARLLLGGSDLDGVTAAANKVDGPPGFFLATEFDAAEFFALRRSPAAVLKYELTDDALSQLQAAGAVQQLIPFGGKALLPGEELVVPVQAFPLFNQLRAAGEVRISPGRRTV
jgi:hypothetical protein